MIDIRDRCCWKRCRQGADLTLYGAGICDRHNKALGEEAELRSVPVHALWASKAIPEARSTIGRPKGSAPAPYPATIG